MTATAWLWVLPGCALGALLRFWITELFAQAVFSHWPAGTLVVNLSGSFALGVLLSVVNAGKLLNVSAHSYWVMAAGAGFLGTYTTYSSFALQVHTLFKTGKKRSAQLYVLATVLGGLSCLGLGYWIVNLCW